MYRKLKSFLLKFLVIVLLFICFCNGEKVKKDIDDNGDDNDTNEDGGSDSLDIQPYSDAANNSVPCPSRRQNTLMHEIKRASPGQFPFIAAVMSQQNEYLCTGTVVSNGLVLTTAKCAKKSTNFVLFNATTNKQDDTTEVRYVVNIAFFPTYYDGGDSKDVAVLYVEKSKGPVHTVKISNYTSASKLSEVEAVGYGLNAQLGQTKELQYIGAKFIPGYSTIDMLGIYFDCVETKVLTCFKDVGGPVIYDNELIGIVAKGQDICSHEITATYSINKRIADVIPSYTFKAWIDEMIQKNDEKVQEIDILRNKNTRRLKNIEAEVKAELDKLKALGGLNFGGHPHPCKTIVSFFALLFIFSDNC